MQLSRGRPFAVTPRGVSLKDQLQADLENPLSAAQTPGKEETRMPMPRISAQRLPEDGDVRGQGRGDAEQIAL